VYLEVNELPTHQPETGGTLDPASPDTHYIAIEGPIRAGKTSLARILAETLHAQHLAEPDGNPFLDGFYAGLPTAFAAQMWFLNQRFQQMNALEEGVIVADYIFEKDKIFACLNLTDAELELYNHFYQPMHARVRTPDLVIYLRATPEVLKQRLKRKNLPEEREISEEYIEQIAASYEHFFAHYSAGNLLIVDTTEIDFVNNAGDLQALLNRLKEPVKGTQYYLPLPSPVVA
jgi:deoxyadenosine/deoxycytidine kinase